MFQYGDIPAEGQRREMPVLGVLEKIAAETEKTQRGIQQLSGDLQTQHEIARLGDIDTDEPSAERAKTPKVPFREKLTEAAIEEITSYQLEKPSDYIPFGEFAAEKFYNREEFLNDEYKRSVIKRDDWMDWLYKINKDITGNLKKDTLEYRSYRAGVDSYTLKRQQKSGTPKRPPRKPQAKKIAFTPAEQSGKPTGATKKFATGSSISAVKCPGNILSDISRLEVLIGGKRAGNNSAEIINEAADICRRLFAGGVMDINVYRELIAELMENRRDAYGCYSD